MSYAGATIETTINARGFLRAFNDAIFNAIKDEFEGPILQDAKANSPLGTEKLDDNKHLIRNRDSLRAKAFFTHEGPMGKLWTTSGHGYFLEVGTRFMGARPYAWPAVQKHIGALMARIHLNVSEIQTGEGSPAFELGRALPDPTNE
jgi:hypothetical protein